MRVQHSFSEMWRGLEQHTIDFKPNQNSDHNMGSLSIIITLCCRYVDHVFTTSYLRELPELAKQFVMRTLFADQPIPETLVAAWVKSEHQKYDTLKSSCIGHLICDVHLHTVNINDNLRVVLPLPVRVVSISPD